MSIQPQDDLLRVLRANLRRIEEEHGDADLTEDARELKQVLMRRIKIIETAIENLNNIIREHAAQKPADKDDEP